MLLAHCDEACRRFISNIKGSGFLIHLLPQPINVTHGYGLRSGFSCSEFCIVRTDCLSIFVTHSYKRVQLFLPSVPQCIYVFCVELTFLVI